MKAAFEAGEDDEKVLRAFFGYFYGKGVFDELPEPVIAGRRRNLAEIEAVTRSDDRFPPVDRDAVRKLKVPILILSGSKTKAVARYTDPELERLLPKESSRRVILDGADHMMWVREPIKSRNEVLRFIRGVRVGRIRG